MESFIQFLTRRTGFGKTPWPQFALIMAVVVILACIGVVTWHDRGWVPIAFAVAIISVLIYGSWRNWKGKQG